MPKVIRGGDGMPLKPGPTRLAPRRDAPEPPENYLSGDLPVVG